MEKNLKSNIYIWGAAQYGIKIFDYFKAELFIVNNPYFENST